MNLIRISLLSLLFILVLNSCTKDPTELPEITQPNQPVFGLNGLVAQDIFNHKADTSGYFMFTDFEKDAQNIYTFIGRLANPNCTDCKAITIKIRAHATATAGNLDITQSIREGSYLFQQSGITADTITTYGVHFRTDDAQGAFPLTYNWNFGNGDSLSTATPELLYTYNAPGTYPVQLQIVDAAGCSSFQEQQVRFSEDSCKVRIRQDSTGLLLAEASSATGVFFYQWSTGDSLSFLQPLTAGLYCVTVTTDEGCENVACVTFGSQPGQSPLSCFATFDYDAMVRDSVSDGENLQLSTVVIEYKSPTGAIYSSNLQTQASDSFFEILSVEEYEKNELGHSTKKLAVRFSCQVFLSDGRLLQLSNFNGTIAVAYPNL